MSGYAVRKETSSTVSVHYYYPGAPRWSVAHPAPNRPIGRAEISHLYVATQEHDLSARFRELVRQWKEETLDMSSLSDMVIHPAYLQIIALGPKVLPLLIEELRAEPDYWFVALKAIANTDPVTPQEAGNLDQMTDAWLNWAEKNGM